MTSWNTEAMLAHHQEIVDEQTKDWTEKELRDALARVIASASPLVTTLSALGDNPNVTRGGMTVSSGLFVEQSDDMEENQAYFYDPDIGRMVVRDVDFTQEHGDEIWLREVNFNAGVEVHPEIPILTVVQSALAASIHRGTFCLDDVYRLRDACRLVKK